MKKRFEKMLLLIATVAFILLFSTIAYPGVSLVWELDPIPSDLAGFDIRVNGDNDTLTDVGPVLFWSGELALGDGNNTIDIRTKDLSGQVSPWSETIAYDPIPGTPNITIVIYQ